MPPISPTTVPTSFVPKQPVKTGGRFSQSGNNALLFVAIIILGVSILGAVGIFAAQKYLENVRDKKAQEVTDTQNKIDTEKVQEFIRTRDRFRAAQGLLENHVAGSRFFDLLDTVTLKTVRFSQLSLTVADDRSAKVEMVGTARTFNALAAQSSLLAGEKQIKRAIFSDINVAEDKTVTFALAAEVDSKLLTLSPEEVTMPVVETATTTATSTAPTAPATSTAPTTPNL